MDKALKGKIREALGFHSNEVVFKRDGTVQVREGYFYRHGRTSEKLSASVKARLEEAGLTATVVSDRDHWAPWPKNSYFEAVLKVCVPA